MKNRHLLLSLLLVSIINAVDTSMGIVKASEPVLDEAPISQAPTAETADPTKKSIVKLCPLSQNTVSNQEPVLIENVIKITGGSVFSEQDYQRVANSLKEKNFPPEQFRTKFAEAIIQLYLDKGYITSTAIPASEKSDEIQIIEGRIEKIELEGNKRISTSYICSRISLGIATPLNTNALEDQLKLLRTDPIFKNLEATLIPSGNPGVSKLKVLVQEASSFNSSFAIDNNSPPSVGSERFGVDLSYRNLTGIGDEISTSYYRTFTGGAEVLNLAYQVPVNAKNGTVTLRGTVDRNEITQAPFNELGIRGNQKQFEVSYRQPLIRTPREEFALSLGFAFQEGQTFIFNELPNPFGIGPNENGVSRTSVIKFSQDYTKRDPQGAWSVRSQFNFGTGLFGATSNKQPIPDGNFISWVGQVQRVQRLNDNHLLLLLADLQLTLDSLLGSQQFTIGGSQSVRGYRQNARFGDNGFRFTAEDRITLQRDASAVPVIQLIPFVDLGVIWNKSDNPNKLPRQTFLASTGVGLLWNQAFGTDGLTLRLDYGLPLINLNDKGNNLQDNGLYFSIRYQP